MSWKDINNKAYDEEWPACDCCGWTAPDLELLTIEPSPSNNNKDGKLCELCASTMIGNMWQWPTHYDNAELGKILGWIGNRLLAEIKTSKR